MEFTEVFNKISSSDRVKKVMKFEEFDSFWLKKATVIYDGYKVIKTNEIRLYGDKLVVLYGKGKAIKYPLTQGEDYSVYRIEEFIITTLIVS